MALGLDIEERIPGAAFAFAPQAMVVVDSTGEIQSVNRAAEQLYGYSPGELVGRPVEILIPVHLRKDSRAHLASCFSQPRSGKVLPSIELPARKKCGADFPAEVVGVREGPLLIMFVIDLTERKVLESERDRFFGLFDLSPDLLCITGMDGAFLRVNPAFSRTLGWTAEELTSAPFGRYIHPDDLARTKAYGRCVLEGRDLKRFENRFLCKDGSFRWLQWTAPAQKPGDDFFYAAARDITEAKQLEEERERLIALVENSSDFIALAAPDGSRHYYVNRAGREMLGLPELETLRKLSISDVMSKHRCEDPSYDGRVREVHECGSWRGTGTFHHFLTGEPIPMDVNSFMVADRSGSGPPLAWAVVARDIREQQRTEERLRALTGQLFRMLGEERSRIARELHDDITQKLAALGIDLGMILEELKPGALSEQLVSLQEQILGLSEDVRTLAYQHHPAVLQHSGLVDALREHCREVSRQAAIRIDFSSHDVPSPLSPEISVTLYRIVQEALRNIMKHSAATAASVILSCVERDGGKKYLRLSVIDNGCGFAVAEVKQGAGLGLLSIEERARLVDGTVTISSVREEGSRVETEIPL